jgi:beta-glucosidase
VIEQLTLEQKVALLTGADFWSTRPEPAIGLRRMVLSDGPAGVRGETFDERDPSLSLPSGTALGATWDADLARRYGAALGAEARRQGVDVVLGPTINLHRAPSGGRHFECLSEDPLLTAELAAAYVAGVQGHRVGATPKHYVGNDAETDRFTVDDRIDERTLREVYLAPFEAAVRAGAWLVMSAYNSVNGATMSENPLLRSPLADEWGFDGVVVSDWTAVRSTEASANAAQDLAMPGPEGPWGDALVAAVREGRVPEAAIDEKVERLLRLADRVGALDGSPAPPAGDAEDGVALAREVAAAGTVLVRNDGELPWSAPASVAVLGANAVAARTQGGGSATVRPREVVSPLAGLRAALPGAEVRYAVGAQVGEGVQPLDPASVAVDGAAGARVRYLDADGVELRSEHRLATTFIWLGPDLPAGTATIEVATRWTPPAPGVHHLGAMGGGESVLTVDGTEVLRATTSAADGGLFDPPSRTVPVELDGPAELLLRHVPAHDGAFVGVVALALGVAALVPDADAEIAAAAALAAGCEVALVVVGTDEQIESEGTDRTTLALPGRQDDLVRAVAAANPRTVVVVNAGAPVLLPWRDDVAAVLLGWFGGEQCGTALADVLLGVREPGGRLPTTWPATGEERAVLDGFPVDGRVVYDEGVHIGHRGWLRTGETPAYPFGHGLGYTTLSLAPATVTGREVAVEVTNTGDRTGREVVQVYLAREDSAVDRPVRWLAGWAAVELAPGATATARVEVPERSLAHWDGGWAVEPGEFAVHVGTSVADTTPAGPITVP